MHVRLARWARRHCTAILNPLPRRQWHRGHIDTYRARLDFPAGAGTGLPRNTRLGVRLTDPGELPPLRLRPLLSAIPVPVPAFPDGPADFARFAAGRRLPHAGSEEGVALLAHRRCGCCSPTRSTCLDPAAKPCAADTGIEPHPSRDGDQPRGATAPGRR
ncbi:hypothetical protein J0910_31105 [Nocardiopsis sp. CNT-189]|uniref:hypothetical protein n=1 Tax=Nocardiopsis oceanisediminis TaxID=2816862 RepID=UPI003B385158